MKRGLTLRIVLERPPAGVDFGLQKGHGSAYETILKKPSQGENLSFEFIVDVRPAGKDMTHDFGGPFVQGPRGERFVYLDIGTLAGQADSCWSRRLKVPLKSITLEMIGSEATLEVRIPGTGRDGGPSCGSAKPVGGWKLAAP